MSCISKLSAKQWFMRRDAYMRKYKKGISVISKEIVPGEKKHLERFTRRQKGSTGIVIFSSYLSDGEHKVVIKPADINYIYFMKNHFIAK